MPKTKKGIYHNLKESKYTISNSEVVFFFSSKVYMQKYLDRYAENRCEFLNKVDRVMGDTPLDMSMIADISLYESIEKRGFRAWLKGVEIDSQELYRYALRKMIDNNPVNWFQVVNPRTLERMEAFK